MIDSNFSICIHIMTAIKGWCLTNLNWLNCSGYAGKVVSYPIFTRLQPFIKVGKS